MAVSEYDKKNLSQKQQDRIAEVTAQAQSGKMTWADAHKEAESIRNNAGYSGGRYGNEYNSSKSNGGASGSSSKGSYNGIEYNRSNNGGGIYGVPTSNSQQKNYKQGGVTYQVGADMSRRPDLAGGYAVSNGYTVFYDNNGYAYKASKGTVDYTPHQDINAGNGSYNKNGAWTDNEMLTAADRKKIADIRAQMQAGKITGDQANQAANAIRAGYGYTIDKNGYVTDSGALSATNDLRRRLGLSTDPENAELGYYRYLMGTDTSPLAQAAGQVKSYEDFMKDYTPGQQITYPTVGNVDILQGLVNNGFNTSDAGRPSFDYTYDSEMRALIDQILNSNLADWKQGDQYAALRDQYSANGEMGMADLLGQVSSRTGGLASSYAASVANQEYNDWMSKLEQAAREMYQQDRSDKLNSLGVLSDAYDREYGEYGDKLNQWNADRDFAYQQTQDALANQWKQKEWDYNMSQDEWNKAAQQADMMASYGDFSGYKALGYTDSQIESMRQAYQIAQAAKAKSGRSGSSGGKKSGDSGMKLSVAKDNAKQGIFTPDVLDAFHNAGYSDEYLESAYGYERPSAAGSGNVPNFGDLKRSIQTLVAQGSGDRAFQLYNQYFDSLSTKQQEELNRMLGA
ncbi:MAG: hypothetical protein BHV90_14770 [Clostridiales bacterium 42_27]|jgi:hypothetical protein|nr:MAG: hypothetical protein BHV90_14770 [Clostridiales bacterium 42_27]